MTLYAIWLLRTDPAGVFSVLLVTVLLLAISAATSAWDLLGAIGEQTSS